MPPLINYNSPSDLKAFLDERGLGMRKKFGQNFLINPSARFMLLDALELKPGDKVWEIGPGLGAMTAGLVERSAFVTAFEIDPAFAQILRELYGGENSTFHLVEGDVLKTWPSYSGDEDLYLLGNLPYNVAAAIIADFIEKGQFFKRMVVTVQKEVAQRMVARPKTHEYSSFSVLCSSVYKVKPLKVIKASSFYPVPRVDSQGVSLELISPAQKRSKLFTPLVRGLFSSRRKTIRNTLTSFAASAIIDKDLKGKVEDILIRSGLSGDRRPETLDIEEFSSLANFLEEAIKNES